MAEPRTEIAVVVPTFRRADGLARLLRALAAQTLDPGRWELVVVDDCSGDPEVDEILASVADRVPCTARALSTPRNGGPAMARNLGWRSCDAPLVAFVDDDVVPEPGWLEGGLAAFDAPGVGVVQGRTRVPDGTDTPVLPAWTMFREVDEAGPYFEACNIFYRRDALQNTTGFDEVMRWWGEDTALGWQVVESGWDRAFAPAAGVVHDVQTRGPGWFLSNGWLEHHVVELAARHPGYRDEAFWRPWAVRRRDATFALACVSAVAAVRWRPALLGVVPYLWFGRPAMRPGHLIERCIATVAADAARAAGHAFGSWRHRVLVL